MHGILLPADGWYLATVVKVCSRQSTTRPGVELIEIGVEVREHGYAGRWFPGLSMIDRQDREMLLGRCLDLLGAPAGGTPLDRAHGLIGDTITIHVAVEEYGGCWRSAIRCCEHRQAYDKMPKDWLHRPWPWPARIDLLAATAIGEALQGALRGVTT